MIGHGLAHVTFGGVALGLFLSLTPILVALGVAVLSALGILHLKERAGLYGDTAIGIISSLGMALGIILVSLAGSFNVDLFGYLFGNVLAIDAEEVWVALILTLVVLSAIALFYQEFVYLTFDSESARVSGVRVHRLESLLAMLTAVTVVLGMKVVGILLVSALLVIFTAAVLSAILRGLDITCGCFTHDPGVATLGWGKVLENIGLLCASLVLLYAGEGPLSLRHYLRRQNGTGCPPVA